LLDLVLASLYDAFFLFSMSLGIYPQHCRYQIFLARYFRYTHYFVHNYKTLIGFGAFERIKPFWARFKTPISLTEVRKTFLKSIAWSVAALDRALLSQVFTRLCWSWRPSRWCGFSRLSWIAVLLRRCLNPRHLLIWIRFSLVGCKWFFEGATFHSTSSKWNSLSRILCFVVCISDVYIGSSSMMTVES
jgi:hypothetical protein